MEKGRILIAEDDIFSFGVFKNYLVQSGYQAKNVKNGREALDALRNETYDVVVFDLELPSINGMDLASRIRTEIFPHPTLILTMSGKRKEIENQALDQGINQVIFKPIDLRQLYNAVVNGIKKTSSQQTIASPLFPTKKKTSVTPPFPIVVIAASTGGPQVLEKFLKYTKLPVKAPIVIVLHGVDWSLQYWAEYMDEELDVKFQLAKENMKLESGEIYLAPGDKHLIINENYNFSLDDGPKECFVKPSANPLFRTAASTFGEFCVGIVFTGLGDDGTAGSKKIAELGGSVIVQDPTTAPAPFMPKATIEKVPQCDISTLENIGNMLPSKIELLENQLKLKKSK